MVRPAATFFGGVLRIPRRFETRIMPIMGIRADKTDDYVNPLAAASAEACRSRVAQCPLQYRWVSAQSASIRVSRRRGIAGVHADRSGSRAYSTRSGIRANNTPFAPAARTSRRSVPGAAGVYAKSYVSPMEMSWRAGRGARTAGGRSAPSLAIGSHGTTSESCRFRYELSRLAVSQNELSK
jgi:hypothetical protein